MYKRQLQITAHGKSIGKPRGFHTQRLDKLRHIHGCRLPDVYKRQSYNTSFDGEGAITSAIDYVVSEELPQLYLLDVYKRQSLYYITLS